MKKLKEVSMKKALETLGATDIKVHKKGYWLVSGQFTLNGKRYRYSSSTLSEVVIAGTESIDLNADAPLFYHELRENGTLGNNRFDLNERFAAVGVRVPMSKQEYDPWNAWKRTPKSPKPLKTCGTCANYESGICRATGIIRSVHSLDICHWNKHTPLKTPKK
jgi:hypothetical protein